MAEEKFVDVSKWLAKPWNQLKGLRNRVYRVGIELEGGWKVLPPGTMLVRDGSVFRRDGVETYTPLGMSRPLQRQLVGELPSPVLVPYSSDPNVLTMEKWLNQHYPQYSDFTCGLHVHMSFRNYFYWHQLMRDEKGQYMWTMVEFLRRWAEEKVAAKKLPKDHCIFERLKGESEYCQAVWHPDLQIVKRGKEFDHHGHGHRYTIINFSGRTQTIESRVLPMFASAELALSAIERTLQITSAFLAATAAREKPIHADLSLGQEVAEKTVFHVWA